MEVQDAIGQAYKNGYEDGVKSVTDNNVGDKITPTDKDINVLTNADRIRAMSDEELVKWVSDGCPPGEHKCNGVACDDCWMQWLKQPAEVDNG